MLWVALGAAVGAPARYLTDRALGRLFPGRYVDEAGGDRDEIAQVRERYLQGVYPASTLVQVAALAAPNLKLEIEAVAAL